MPGIIGVIVSFSLVIMFDTKKLKTVGKLKVIVIYCFLMLSSLIISLLLVTGNRPASPADFIEAALRSLRVIK